MKQLSIIQWIDTNLMCFFIFVNKGILGLRGDLGEQGEKGKEVNLHFQEQA